MKIGRNAPCPCGSGKKYKKCCLRTDEQKAAEERQHNAKEQEIIDSEESGLNDNTVHEDSPDKDKEEKDDDDDDENEESESDRIWNEFEDGDFDQRASIIEKILDDPNLFEQFDCFELFDGLHNACQHLNDRQVFKKLTLRLKQEYPDRYENKLGYLLQTLIHDALIEENKTEVENLFLEFADNADADIDAFNKILDQMAFWGDLDLMRSAMHKGWEKVKDSSKIVPWGVDEYANLAVEYEIFKHISEVSKPGLADPKLLKNLEKFIDPDIENLKIYLTHITGTSGKVWKIDDFNFQIKNQVKKRKRKKSRDEPKRSEKKKLSLETFSRNVHNFTNEFLRYLTREEGFSFPKAEIARTELRRYIIKRAQGELEEEPSLFEKMMHPELKNKKQPPPSFDHILCPDKKTLDRFIGGMLSFFSFRLFRAAICFESIPAWLRFVETKGMIGHEMRRKTVTSIYELYASLRKILDQEDEDKQCLIQHIEKAYSDRSPLNFVRHE